jgi:hypothetical protein
MTAKLAGSEFAAAALKNAGMTPHELAALRKRLERHDRWEVSECRAAVRRLVRFCRDPHLPAPPADAARVRWACFPPAQVALGIGPLQLLALAAAEATERYPGAFPAGSPSKNAM